MVRARFCRFASPFHFHREYEIGIVASGRRLVRRAGEARVAPPGSILVFAPREAHAGSPVDEVGSTYRSFLIPTEGLCALPGWGMAGTIRCPAFEPIIVDPELALGLLEVHRALAFDPADPKAEQRLASILVTLAARHRSRASPAARMVVPVGIGRVLEHLEANYPAKIQLSTLAAIANLSVFHLVRLFRSTTGLPPYAYLQQIRINHAARLLRQGVAVSRVALLTGFADQSHLTRFFRRLVGVPPGRYRRAADPIGAASPRASPPPLRGGSGSNGFGG